MSMFKKSMLFGMLLLAGAGLGLLAGWKLSSSHALVVEWRSFDNPEGHEFFKTYDSMARLKIIDMGSATSLQNPESTPERRREYLNLILEAAEKARSQATDPAALTLINVETSVAYVRLAIVEEAGGNLPLSQTWMQKAQGSLKQTGWNDCSELHLKELAQSLNKRDSL